MMFFGDVMTTDEAIVRLTAALQLGNSQSETQSETLRSHHDFVC
jgi:hypothetical protein